MRRFFDENSSNEPDMLLRLNAMMLSYLLLKLLLCFLLIDPDPLLFGAFTAFTLTLNCSTASFSSWCYCSDTYFDSASLVESHESFCYMTWSMSSLTFMISW